MTTEVKKPVARRPATTKKPVAPAGMNQQKFRDNLKRKLDNHVIELEMLHDEYRCAAEVSSTDLRLIEGRLIALTAKTATMKEILECTNGC